MKVVAQRSEASPVAVGGVWRVADSDELRPVRARPWCKRKKLVVEGERRKGNLKK